MIPALVYGIACGIFYWIDRSKFNPEQSINDFTLKIINNLAENRSKILRAF